MIRLHTNMVAPINDGNGRVIPQDGDLNGHTHNGNYLVVVVIMRTDYDKDQRKRLLQ